MAGSRPLPAAPWTARGALRPTAGGNHGRKRPRPAPPAPLTSLNVTTDHRSSVRELVERDSFQRAVMAVIVVNAITLGPGDAGDLDGRSWATAPRARPHRGPAIADHLRGGGDRD